MSTLTSRAFTVYSSRSPGNIPKIVIGAGNGQEAVQVLPPKQPSNNYDDTYWVTIFKRSNLQEPIANSIYPAKDNDTIPAELKKYNDDADYMFTFVCNYLNTQHLPQGKLFEFLLSNGAGRQLRRLEQIHTALGCGGYGHASYVLANLFKDRDSTGFEESTLSDPDALMTIRLIPLDINGTIMYIPAELEN